MANIIVKKTERDYREAAYRAGLSPRRYGGLARSEEEAHDLARRLGGDEGPGFKPIAVNDRGQADREQMLHAGIPEEHIENREIAAAKQRRGGSKKWY